MSGHDRGDPGALEELKASVLLGEVPLDDPRVEALPNQDREELEQLLGVCTALDEEAASAPVSAADEELARRFLEAQEKKASESAAPIVECRPTLPPPRMLGRVAGWLALAAGVVIMVWSFFGPENPEGGGTGRLGAAPVTIEAIEPVGPVDRFSVFRWSGTCPVRSSWQVRIEFEDDNGDRREIVSPRRGQNSWEPGERLPDRIRWRVDIVHFDSEEITEGPWVEALIRDE